MAKSLGQLGEAGLIAAMRAALGQTSVAPPEGLGIGDDAALIPLGGPRLIATVDALIEGVHFTRALDDPFDVGWKALAVNLSDIAAMGGTPRAALVALSAPGDLDAAWVEACYRGIAALAAMHGVWIAGGDTTGSPGPVMVSVTALGDPPPAGGPGGPLTRGAARPGDVFFSSGWPGRSAAGRAAMERGAGAPATGPATGPAVDAHRRPVPQVAAGRALAGLGVRLALLDDSDGLARAAQLVAAASGCDVELAPDAWPRDPVLAAEPGDAVALALFGGEDYHLVGACAPADWPAVAAALGPEARIVGRVEAGAGLARVRRGEGPPEALAGEMGHAHFAQHSFPPRSDTPPPDSVARDPAPTGPERPETSS